MSLDTPPLTLAIADEGSPLADALIPRLSGHGFDCRLVPAAQCTDPAALRGHDVTLVSRRLRLIQERTLGDGLAAIDRASRIVVALPSNEFVAAAAEFRAPVFWFFVDRQLPVADSVLFLAREGFAAVPSDLHDHLFARCEDWITERMIDAVLAGLRPRGSAPSST
jgi:hypothetical protein